MQLERFVKKKRISYLFLFVVPFPIRLKEAENERKTIVLSGSSMCGDKIAIYVQGHKERV